MAKCDDIFVGSLAAINVIRIFSVVVVVFYRCFGYHLLMLAGISRKEGINPIICFSPVRNRPGCNFMINKLIWNVIVFEKLTIVFNRCL